MAYSINQSSSDSDLELTESSEEEEVEDVNNRDPTLGNDPYRFEPILSDTDVDQDPNTEPQNGPGDDPDERLQGNQW